jgi:aminoglycoside phosphotransferase (APT) family kinase protein
MPIARRDLEETRRQLRDWLAGKLTGASDVHVGEVGGPSDTGFSSDTLLFDADWTEAGTRRQARLVARLKPSGVAVFPNYDMPLQYRVVQILGSHTDVPVPRVRWLEEQETALGTPFYVMDRVEGRVPTDNPPYHIGGWVSELSPEQRTALWWNGLEAMTKIHRLDWRPLGFDFLDGGNGKETPLVQHLRYYDDFFSWGMDRSRYPLIQRAQRWLEDNRPPDETIALCWGDSRPSNQIFDDRMQCAAVLDWEMVRIGDPVQDLAWWISIDRCLSEGIGAARLDGFPDRPATIARWEELVGRDALHVEYYEVFALYRFAIIMSRVSQQLKDAGILPPESDMDVNNLASTVLAKAMDQQGA